MEGRKATNHLGAGGAHRAEVSAKRDGQSGHRQTHDLGKKAEGGERTHRGLSKREKKKHHKGKAS